MIQILNFAMILTTAYMTWKGLGLITNSESPIVVVLSGSMEPAFQRGDLLFLTNNPKHVNVGDIVVYNVKERSIPIVHRVLQSFVSNTTQKILTKGDNNQVDDVGLYARGQTHLDRDEHIIGVAKGFIPYIGMVTILVSPLGPDTNAEGQLNDFPWIKYCMLAILGGMAIFQRE
ncbi:Signal peptidase complex catalytic subunit SEC11 [Neolecta irregularis DAH-3]|uniref:Signal peptidase complex catalytic subunit SEC11 n=1 Tax=Neolecta irregularis (strain DAH-3) TaxID=1198029 RepID=A0A1U7LPL1_NEOID|nr:Signal peptidase complex catalytic subunit SEC11 [Neolecta irregularis DAH-3]|eukprot:OLL24482.1 Signal peptidase complex catalytic subunit SEC11 [Neolecta irregularis DAH-3]